LSVLQERLAACLKGLATGDAVGKQTETLSRQGVRRWYPDGVRGFEGAAGDVIPRYTGNAKRAWRVGETTDDTEGTLAVARAILGDGSVRHTSVGRELLQCRKSVHPGVRSLWEFHQAGDPARIARHHDGCGAAIRVAPVGVVYRSDRLDRIVAAAREASIPTHGGALAIAAAAATAAAVSAAIDGAPAEAIVEIARRAAAVAEGGVTGSTESLMAQAILEVHADLSRRTPLDADEVAARHFPDAPLRIVPLAISLATVMDAADAAILLAANVGGDSDSVASIAGAILGASHPATVNDDWYAVVARVNDLDLVTLAAQLGALRS
jgi:ADP-ribosylglycohydrolase